MTSGRFIPTISELRTFESVARLRSISAAAAELNCSQPTATWRLRELERRWSVTLFTRSTRSLEWTESTQRFYARVRRVLNEVESISAEIQEAPVQTQLSVTVSPSFAAAWLVGRLAAFNERHPQTDLRLSASNRFVDMNREAMDVAVRLLNRGTVPGERLHSHVLLDDERLILVCSPTYASRWPEGTPLGALAQTPLLGHEETDHWSRFFQTYLPDSSQRNGPSFNNADLIIRSAIAHQGVAIVREVLASDALVQGQLVQPWPHSLPCEDAYHLLHKRGGQDNSKISDLRDWLQQELALSVSHVRAASIR
ncbi:MAG: LysR substrate-binding domain-containing protein [Rhodoferax sp.]